MSIGERLRQRRTDLGLSQRELAKRIGVRQATISDIESGRQKETSTGVARRLAFELGVTLDWLIGPHVRAEGSVEEEEMEAAVA